MKSQEPAEVARRWPRRFLLVVLAPAVVLGVAELALRAFGFGYPTNFVLPGTIDGQRVWTDNQVFCRTFHGIALARTPEPFVIPVAKATNELRVVVLGSSAAMGDPHPASGFARMLETVLRSRHPGQNIAVVNAAMTAVNSHVVRLVARDCLRLQPDCFIVLMGNNEVIGPYGPGTAFAPMLRSRALIRLSIGMKQTRLAQLVDRLSQDLSRDPGLDDPWKGMELFAQQRLAAADPALRSMYAHFDANLQDIVATAGAAGVPVVLCTVPVNLADCAPFADPDGRATAAYRRGQAALLTRDRTGAYAAFTEARDADALRFRADSTINAIIRRTAAGPARSGVRLLDAETAFAAAATNGVPGDDLFVDHVHYTLAGNYVLASNACVTLEQTLSSLAPGSAAHPDTFATIQDCARTLGHTEWDEAQIADLMFERMLRPPFTWQCDHEQRLQHLARRLRELRAGAAHGEGDAVFVGSMSARDSWVALQKAAAMHRQQGLCDRAAEELGLALKQVPHSRNLHREHAIALALCSGDRIEDACEELQASAPELYRSRPVALEALGVALFREGRTAQAGQLLEQALTHNGPRPSLHNNYGLLLLAQGRADAAEPHFRAVLARAPKYAPALANLGLCLAREGRHEEALQCLTTAIELAPYDGDSQSNLALLLLSTGRAPEALPHLQRAVALRPDSAPTYNNLGYVLSVLGRAAESVPAYREALAIDPDQPRVAINLADALHQIGQTREALTAAQSALTSATAKKDAELAGTIRQRIGVYQASAQK